MGTLTPTPSVSVPQMTFSKPCCGELLFDQHTILGQQPGVMQADAVAKPFLDLGAVGTGELEAFQARRRAPTFSSRVQTLMLVKSCALCAASNCVKWTT